MNIGKKVLTAATALLCVSTCFTACGSEDGNAAGSESEATTTPSATVAVNTEVLNEEDQATVDNVADKYLKDVELENKTIKWLAHYDINPTTSGNSKSVQLELFDSKYGGNVQYYPTTWASRYSDLSTYVLGGEGIDFFPVDTEALPRGVVSGMFQPVDEYIDLDSELWDATRNSMEIFNFAGKHYNFCTGVSPMAVVFYNKQTIEANGLDDPWELYEAGNWNWNTFKDMLMTFVDPDAEQYGLDGWFFQNPLSLSGGMAAVSSVDGKLKLNLNEPALERTMLFAEDLYKNGLTLDLSLFDWSEQPQFMGEGKELFYLCGSWHAESDPTLWSSKIEPENMGIVPVPCDPEGTPSYSIAAEGFLLCKGAANPEGVARYVECCLVAGMDEETNAIGREKRKNDFGWTDEMLEHYDECVRLAKEYPIFELGSGVSTDFNTIVTSYATYEPFRGGVYSQLREEVNETAETLLQDVNDQLAAMAEQ
ncbi:MAG: ABC transporter substrate-binding protein [Huintestinicola sp.]